MKTRAALCRAQRAGTRRPLRPRQDAALGQDRAAPPHAGVCVSDFGTRRRHSFLWQEYAWRRCAALGEDRFTGTSNTALAYKHDLEAIGTNAHELPMALAAIARPPTTSSAPRSTACSSSGRRAMAGSCSSCCPTPSARRSFSRALPTGWRTGPVSASTPRIPTSRATSTLRGCRRRARSPDEAPHRLGRSRRRRNPRVCTTYFNGRIRFSAGWGTLLTNDFRGCHPRGEDTLEPLAGVQADQRGGGRR